MNSKRLFSSILLGIGAALFSALAIIPMGNMIGTIAIYAFVWLAVTHTLAANWGYSTANEEHQDKT